MSGTESGGRSAWADARRRAKWLAEKFTIRKATENKSMRITWSDGETSVEVMIYAKSAAKSQVTVEHSKIADKKRAEELKAFWSERVEKLKEMLEG